jgi:hypothetical protein
MVSVCICPVNARATGDMLFAFVKLSVGFVYAVQRYVFFLSFANGFEF